MPPRQIVPTLIPMKTSHGPIIDMTSTGEFAWQGPPRPSLVAILVRLAIFTILLGLGALVFWLAVFTVPLLIVGGLLAYAYVRFKLARGGFALASVVRRPTRR